MIVMCFDLSSTCIGVTFAQINKKELVYIKTLPIIPKKPSGKDLGYKTKNPQKIEYMGNKFTGFLKPDEFEISKTEAKKRMSEFKSFSHRKLLMDIGHQIGYFLKKIKPDHVAIEKNKSFNGVLTTKLLAEIAGGMYFYTGATGTKMFDYDESTVRARIRRDIKDFDLYKNGTDEMAVDTKWEIYCRLRSYFEKEHPGLIDFDGMTMDESDSLAVFYYYYVTEVLA